MTTEYWVSGIQDVVKHRKESKIDEQYRKKFSKKRYLKFVDTAKTWGEYVFDNMKLVYAVKWKFSSFKDTQPLETVVYEVNFPDGNLYLVDTVTETYPFIDFIDAIIFNSLQEAVDFVNREHQDNDIIKVLERRFADGQNGV